MKSSIKYKKHIIIIFLLNEILKIMKDRLFLCLQKTFIFNYFDYKIKTLFIVIHP